MERNLKRIQFGLDPNSKVDAQLIQVKSATEPWSEYLLADGTVLRAKSVMLEVYRVEGAFDIDGRPQYAIRSQQLMTCDPPDSLLKPNG